MENLVNNEAAEDDELRIGKGGLYSAFPIPAYKILVEAKEHVAKDILVCLVSHLGYKSKSSYPSYTTISKETGRGRGSIARGIRTLEDFGYIKKFQYFIGRKKHNKYYLQEACWNHDRMTHEALAYLPVIGRCGCGQNVRNGEIGRGHYAYHHWGCGEAVRMFSTRANE